MTDHPVNSRLPGLAGWMSSQDSDSGLAIDTRELPGHHFPGEQAGCASRGIVSSGTIAEKADTVTCAIVGTPAWTDDAIAEVAQTIGHAEALRRAYETHGDHLTKLLRGAFAFSIIDEQSNRTLLGIDRLGRHTMYFKASSDGIMFGSTAGALLSMAGDSKLSSQGIYNYIYFHMIPAPSSVYTGLHKLQAGTVVTFQDGETSRRRYWLPNFHESKSEDLSQLQAQLKRELATAICASLPESGKVGAFLSGGLDSSSVVGMLAGASDGSCDAYSIGFSADGYDEMEYARITADHFGARLHEYYVTPEDVVAALPMIATAYDEPFGNSSALPAYFCARMAAEDGVDLLLAGDGGDEIFAGNERYAKQGSFDNYQRVPGWLRSGFIEPLVRHLPESMPLASKSRSYLKQANTGLPDRLQYYNFLHQHSATDIFQEDFLSMVDIQQPLFTQKEIYNAPASASSLNRMLFLDWQITLADNDIRKVSQMCSLAGVEVAYPMLEDNLIEFSLAVPSEVKLHNGKLRDFYKSALQDWLPAATINKKKQGFGLPFGVWMHDYKPLQEIAYDNIIKLKSRNIFKPAFLDQAIELHRDGHAAYYGELVWILTVLELWMDKHGISS